MSKKTSGVPAKTLAKISRRQRVIVILEKQLKLGTKRTYNPEEGYNIVPLTEKDILRINKEIETLKSRV